MLVHKKLYFLVLLDQNYFFFEKKKFHVFLQSMKRGRIKGYVVFTQKVSGRFGFQFFEKQTFHKLENALFRIYIFNLLSPGLSV